MQQHTNVRQSDIYAQCISGNSTSHEHYQQLGIRFQIDSNHVTPLHGNAKPASVHLGRFEPGCIRTGLRPYLAEQIETSFFWQILAGNTAYQPNPSIQSAVRPMSMPPPAQVVSDFYGAIIQLLHTPHIDLNTFTARAQTAGAYGDDCRLNHTRGLHLLYGAFFEAKADAHTDEAQRVIYYYQAWVAYHKEHDDNLRYHRQRLLAKSQRAPQLLLTACQEHSRPVAIRLCIEVLQCADTNEQHYINEAIRKLATLSAGFAALPTRYIEGLCYEYATPSRPIEAVTAYAQCGAFAPAYLQLAYLYLNNTTLKNHRQALRYLQVLNDGLTNAPHALPGSNWINNGLLIKALIDFAHTGAFDISGSMLCATLVFNNAIATQVVCETNTPTPDAASLVTQFTLENLVSLSKNPEQAQAFFAACDAQLLLNQRRKLGQICCTLANTLLTLSDTAPRNAYKAHARLLLAHAERYGSYSAILCLAELETEDKSRQINRLKRALYAATCYANSYQMATISKQLRALGAPADDANSRCRTLDSAMQYFSQLMAIPDISVSRRITLAKLEHLAPHNPTLVYLLLAAYYLNRQKPITATLVLKKLATCTLDETALLQCLFSPHFTQPLKQRLFTTIAQTLVMEGGSEANHTHRARQFQIHCYVLALLTAPELNEDSARKYMGNATAIAPKACLDCLEYYCSEQCVIFLSDTHFRVLDAVRQCLKQQYGPSSAALTPLSTTQSTATTTTTDATEAAAQAKTTDATEAAAQAKTTTTTTTTTPASPTTPTAATNFMLAAIQADIGRASLEARHWFTLFNTTVSEGAADYNHVHKAAGSDSRVVSQGRNVLGAH